MFLVSFFKAFRKLKQILIAPLFTLYAKLIFFLNGIKFKNGLFVLGFMKIYVTRRGVVNIGKNFKINSGDNYNVIGRQQKCILWVEGELNVGDNVGMSCTAIICNHKVIIGNNVVIGGNTVIYDTDFHSLNIDTRNKGGDKQAANRAPVIIKDNVFIGAHTTILKGVTINENAVIGACSVVTKDVPPNQIWAGNPAKFIKNVL